MEKIRLNGKRRSNPIAELTIDQLKPVVDLVGCDGHTIFNLKALEECGWPKEAIESVAMKYDSDGSAKGSIFNDRGEMLYSVYGWYGLDVIDRIARTLGVEYEWKDGRGFRAASIYKSLTEYFKAHEVPA